jgi:predicted RND superfamily exporter protein
MLALPLAIMGAFIALLVTRTGADMTAVIGLILLMGLAVKNSILLVDFANRLRAQGMSREDALLTAGPVRLRPVLMTTLSLILGMLPVSLGLGAGGSFRAPMAIAVIGGLISSTILTLLLVPVAYSLMDIGLERIKSGKIRIPFLDKLIGAASRGIANVHVTIPVPEPVLKWQRNIKARWSTSSGSSRASDDLPQTAASGK